ncbi:MAG: 50S ribosomal protein L9 [Alphaproteobacteria bacterium]
MQVILLERVEKLGQMGDTVKVKPGYARNFLLPLRKALRATKENMAHFETQRAQLEAKNLEARKEAEQVDAKLSGLSVIIVRAASESGQLYGSVTARDISDAVTAAGVTVDRTQVLMESPIKTLGIFDFRIRLHPEVMSDIKVNVAQSEDEAKAQAERVERGEDAVVTAADADAEEARQMAEEQAAALAAAAGLDEEAIEALEPITGLEEEIAEATGEDGDAESDDGDDTKDA